MSEMPQPSPPPILILCRDLMFTSKITATAKAHGVAFKVIRDPAKLADEPAGRMMVDLTQEGYLSAAADWKSRTQGHVTGFAGHTDTETLSAAKAAGLDAVFTRGAFTANLDRIIQE
jgi:hypothetical protein